MIPNSFFKLVLSEIGNANFCVDGGGVGKDHFILSEMWSRPPVYHPCCYLKKHVQQFLETESADLYTHIRLVYVSYICVITVCIAHLVLSQSEKFDAALIWLWLVRLRLAEGQPLTCM